MAKKILLSISILLLIGITTAQPIESIETDEKKITAGFFGPDSFLYPVQVGIDNLLNSDEENIVRRSIEANQMLEAGNAPAAERALNQLQNNAEKISRIDIEYIQEAKRAIASAPYDRNAQEGIDNARDALDKAEDRRSGDIQRGRLQGFTQEFRETVHNVTRGNSNNNLADIELPNSIN